MTSKDYINLFHSYKENRLKNRYIHNDHILPLLKNLKANFEIKDIGSSVLNQPIHSIKIGSGSEKILLWSQMHGNESTTTKALFDLCNLFAQDLSLTTQNILNSCTLLIVPILNPDGSKQYTRQNANNIDLNRDAKNVTQPESKVLRRLFNEFQPDFCFNLHGQRTIFNAGNTNNTATMSFLTPAQDKACVVTESRKKSMEVIVAINNLLQTQIPNQVGIYDDTYNDNCVGDAFQSLNCPTILFEAGHFKNDYNREITRLYTFQAILKGIEYIANNNVSGDLYKPYLEIPENHKRFLDVIIRQARIRFKEEEIITDIGIQYTEKLLDDKVEFIPKIEKIGDLSHLFAHNEIEANNAQITLIGDLELCEGLEVESVTIGLKEYSLKIE